MMRKLLFLVTAMVFTMTVAAQNADEMYGKKEKGAVKAVPSEEAGVLQVTIPSKMNIKDFVFVQNLSTNLILQMAVVVEEGKGNYQTVGLASYLPSGRVAKIASFDDNGLRKLRGKKLLIKIKGAKINPMQEGTDVVVNSPWGNVFVDGGKLDAEELKNIDESKITYDFSAILYEKEHDLYIRVESKKIMDF